MRNNSNVAVQFRHEEDDFWQTLEPGQTASPRMGTYYLKSGKNERREYFDSKRSYIIDVSGFFGISIRSRR